MTRNNRVNTSAEHHTSRKKRKINKRNLLVIILVICTALELIVGSAGLIVMSSMLKSKPELDVNDFFSNESSRVFDKDGNQIADVGSTIRDNVSYDELPESLIDAFIAVEDSRYFEHNGFDIARFTKAMLENLKSMSFSQGGSTFTMQLVKLTYFQNDEAGTSKVKSIEYKVQQIFLAMELEQQSDKTSIFEMYLNKMNYGGTGNIRGIQKAAEYYYGKNVSELNLTESAMLAGIINSPYTYDPFNYLDYATNRRDTVLYLMKYHGYITEKEYKLARSVKVEDLLINPKTHSSEGGAYAYQSYIDTAINEAQKLTGQDPTTVAMDIYTYMDTDVQTVMDSIQAGNEESVQWPDELMEVGMISENNQTGEVVAIGGGRNYGRGGSMLLNHATDQYNQPGSSVKPFLDYALAFEYLGWATDHVLTDRPIVYNGTNVVITNATNTYAGDITLEYAVGNSLNTPAIQTLEEVVEKAGWTTVVDYLMSLGFSKVSADNFDIGFAIGGSNFTCSAEELMAAHAIMMNGGNYIEPHTIKRIEYRNGKTAAIEPTYEKTQVLSNESAYLTAHLMYQAVNGPYYNYMQILKRGYAVYGKTGTSDWGTEGLQYNIPTGAAKDKWMVSETTQYTTVVWIGYEKGVKDEDTYISSAKSKLNIPGNISNLILDALNKDSEPAALEQPEGVTSITHILGTFPYASVIEGMDSALITTGLIKTANAETVDASSNLTVSDLGGFNAFENSDGSIQFEWTAYPEADKLVRADGTKDISLSTDSGVYIEAYGTRLFDYTWIFGPIRYKARIKQNDTVIAEISSETESYSQSIDMNDDTQTEVCGYYGYESGTSSSNEVCVVFTTKKNEPEPTPTPAATPVTTPTPTPAAETNTHE